ncbi:MAG TPA: glutamate-cysteine ligase family protein, partial [Blastococcus sp.]
MPSGPDPAVAVPEPAGAVRRPDLLSAPRPAVAGATFGIEEEFHLVDPVTFELTPSPGLSAAAVRHEFGPRIHAELATTQLETASGICSTLGELRAELVASRAE